MVWLFKQGFALDRSLFRSKTTKTVQDWKINLAGPSGWSLFAECFSILSQLIKYVSEKTILSFNILKWLVPGLSKVPGDQQENPA